MSDKQLKTYEKVLLFSLIGLVAIALIAYIAFAIYFKSHFFWHTTVGNVECGGKNAEYVDRRNIQTADDFLLTLIGRDGSKYHIKGSDFNYSYEPHGEVQEMLASQNVFLWPACISGEFSYSLETSASYDENKLNDQIKNCSLFDEANQEDPVDASITFTDSGYELSPEQEGNAAVFDKVLPLVLDAVQNQTSMVTLSDDCYKKPKITTESPEIKDCTKAIDSYMASEITYDIPGQEEKLSSKDIFQMLDLENGKVSLDEEAIDKYVQHLASSYNTYGDKREFKTALGDVLTVAGGDYGYVISKSKEKAQILEDLNGGKPVKREPVYEQTATGPYDNEIGNTYVEIDLTNQHFYYFKDGELSLDGDIVSGRLSNGNGTPDGIYKIVYKERNVDLVGEDYVCPVEYFMPFAYNVGFHDANWQRAFGGELYIDGGSHGCINMIPSDAQKLYETCEIGTPVISYYRTPVELTSESAEISNARSFVRHE